jgi:catechol 2,3-dioxygenase-like lactoylglutathione lyase family enzyme
VSLHGLTSITLGVPDVEAVSRFYEAFGRRAARSAAANDVRGHLL